MDITQTNKVEEDRCSIRMNVDNYEEAVKLLGERGFKSYQGNQFFDGDQHEVPKRVLHKCFGA